MPQQIQKNGPYFIVNLKNRWTKPVLTRTQKPTVLHQSLEAAFTEANRLISKTNGEYAVFECIGCVKRTKEEAKAWKKLRKAEAGGDI